MRQLAFLLFLAIAGCGSADSGDSSESSGDDTTGGDTAQIPPEEGGCPEGGVPPVAGPDGPPENCEVLFEGCCYASGMDACAAAGCEGEECVVMESYPGQISRCE